VTTVARLLRGLVPVLAAGTVATAAALPATAAVAPVTAPAATNASEWWLAALHMPAAVRAAPAAGKGVTVAVLSTGVDPRHPDLTGSVTTGPDFSGTGRSQGSPYWGNEGTAVASLIAGHGHGPGGAEGITGVAPQAKILSVQVTMEYDDPRAADTAVTRHLPDAIAAGIRWAVSHGATVIALPLDPGTLTLAAAGNPAAGGSAAEKAAVSFALAHNVVLVAPACDNGAEGNSVNYPAAYPGVVAVGATTRAGQLSPFSNTGAYVALTAPGAGTTPNPPVSGMTTDPAAGLTVAAPDGGYETLASSDMSAALTAGVAALVRSRYPQLTAAEVAQALQRGVLPPPGGAAGGPAGRGHGALDAATVLSAAAAIAAARPAPAPPSPTPTVRPASPAATHATAARPADPGHLLRSLVVDLAIGAGLLIAFLVGAIAVPRLRRRPRPSRGPGHARHARGQLEASTAPIPARVVIWSTTPTTTSAGSGPPAKHNGTPGRHTGPLARYTGPLARYTGPLGKHSGTFANGTLGNGTLPKRSGPSRRPQPAGNPPWQPATPPRDPAAPPAMLPAQTLAEKPGPPLAPWEQSPEEFAVAPPVDETPWPISNTGPMYVWNPATATGPIIALNEDDD
jgi:subtilisin family serine protease